MSDSRSSRTRGVGQALIWDLLTFDRLLTGPVVHLIYWAGLGVIALMAFSAMGAAIGVAMREASIFGKLLAVPVFVVGLWVCAAGILLWRALCEFYVAIFRISDDLRALREEAEAERNRGG
ncbi:MAG TPA: DUF4282 domain-containing protein [Caulobacteraceae bacterium]